ncbi:MAG: response regulator transcription factor, partial [Candidatus Hodarchaeota archaeon]
VDDEPDIVHLVEQFLILENFDTLTCQSGKEALEIIEKNYQKIALVLLDIMMPEISGWEVLRKIKSNPKYKDIIVVILTVKNFNEDIILGKELGADGYLVKAISGKELQNYVKNILAI